MPYLSRDERCRLYEESMKLNEQNGWGYKRIGHILGVSVWTVREWIKRGRGPYGKRGGSFYYGKCLKESAKNPSWELGYVLGVLCGDAYISNSYIELKTTKLEWAETFTKILREWSGYEPKRYEFDGNNFGKILHCYRVVLHGKDIMTFLTKTGSFGTKVWQVPEMVLENESVQKGFLSGFFDSEGWIGKVDVRACSSNFLGLTQIQTILKQFNIPSQIYSYVCGCKHRLYHYLITEGGRHTAQLFETQIGFQIPSKSEKLRVIVNQIGLGREIMTKKFSGEGNPFYGRTHTKEVKEKIRESNRRRAIKRIGGII